MVFISLDFHIFRSNRHVITEILLKVALNIITLTPSIPIHICIHARMHTHTHLYILCTTQPGILFLYMYNVHANEYLGFFYFKLNEYKSIRHKFCFTETIRKIMQASSKGVHNFQKKNTNFSRRFSRVYLSTVK